MIERVPGSDCFRGAAIAGCRLIEEATMTHAVDDNRDVQVRLAGRRVDDVGAFAEVHGLTLERTLQLIDEHGSDRAQLDVAAATLKAKLASH